MRPIPFASSHPSVIASVLGQRGVDSVRAEAAASGLRPLAVLLTDLSSDQREILLRVANDQGIECLTGDDWVLLAGGVIRLAGLTRPGVGLLPESVVEPLAKVLGNIQTPPNEWHTARGTIDLTRPVVVGILNVTPDSFSDGGLFMDASAALHHVEHLVDDGAQMLDVGAESTRPGRPSAVPLEDEWRRLEPILPAIVKAFPHIPVSVDTVKAAIAERALDVGAWAINDVSGTREDPNLASVCAKAGAGLILMHSRGTVTDMATYDHATYNDVVVDVFRELESVLAQACIAGVRSSSIVTDPGLGFSKKPDHCFRLLNALDTFQGLGCPIMIGPSRKRFLGTIATGTPADRDAATAAACLAGYHRGARLFRVHAVKPVREMLDVVHAIGAS